MTLIGTVMVTRTKGFLELANAMTRDTEYITRWQAEIAGRRDLTALWQRLTNHRLCTDVVLWNDRVGVGLSAPLWFSYHDKERRLLVVSFACSPTAYAELVRGNVMAELPKPVTTITHHNPPTGFLIVGASNDAQQRALVVVPTGNERAPFQGCEPLTADAWGQLCTLLPKEVASM